MRTQTEGVAARPRILIVVENLSVPFDRRVWQESRALQAAGYDVDVICPRGQDHDNESFAEIDGVRIHRYPLRAATGGPIGYIREYGLALWHTFRLGIRLGRRSRYAAVHVCNPPDLLFLPLLWMRLTGTKFVLDHHDLVPELFLSRFGEDRRSLHRAVKGVERLAFAIAHRVISTNESYRRVAIERGKMAPEDVTVVRSAPDLARFEGHGIDETWRRGKKYLACYVGVMGPQDGADYALRALAHLRSKRDDFHVVFIGGGDEFDNLVALSSSLGLDDCVEFTGMVSDNMLLATILATADVGLAPDPLNPLNDLSTMNKIMEYMALGLAIVSFDLIEGRVSAGDAAVYAEPNDEVQFGDLVGELFDDADRRAEMAEIGAMRVSGELSWETSARNLIDFYERLLDR